MNRHFSKDMQIAKIFMKRCSTSLVIREMQIKTIMNYHFTPSCMSVIKTTTRFGEDVEKLEPSIIAGRNVKWCSHFGKQSGNSSIIYTELTYDSAIPLLWIKTREMKTYIHKTSTQMSTAALFIIAKKEENPNVHQLITG